jgi:predicted O-methyltransferase YrrM
LAKIAATQHRAERAAFHAERRGRIAASRAVQNADAIQGDDREQVLAFLGARGLAEAHLVEGSVPERSLEYIRRLAILPLDSSRCLTALHIGNFVGVSLAFVAAALRQRHPDSLVVSVDPNLAHRGINNPQAHVAALLTACGLQANAMIIAGYSGRKSISNDGVVYAGYDPQQEFPKECACEESLRNLGKLCPRAFDLVLMDGNHEAAYLVTEIQAVLPLMKPGGFLVLDDVTAAWEEIREVFSRLASFGLVPSGTDGRVGIARLSSKDPRSEARLNATRG